MATPTFVTRQLGRRLREIRDECDFTLRDVGKYLGKDSTVISKMESGNVGVKRGDLLAFMEMYAIGHDSDLRAELIGMFEETIRVPWWGEYAEHASQGLLDLIWLEQHATSVGAYETDAIPGLLQTFEYAAAVIEAVPNLADDRRAGVLELRMRRQGLLTQTGRRPELTFVLAEAVLRQEFDDPEIMRNQLQHLLTVADQPGVILRVLPLPRGYRPGARGSFVLLEMPSPYPAVAYQETLVGTKLFIEASEIEIARSVYAGLIGQALSKARSSALIETLLEELDEQPAERELAKG
ncbi:transcriptional regulator [Longispora fulva]|uniref:Transcriptional regulator with XRE-family HTH domain n=1 Tax=Longispora fulva TaxID=619741 RepID=A0A8J7GWB5_9ACTN|nr:Scr1 family TA system antitoxin-like transcriptional regulator [Longispora fulva]MBG6139934.1 transcriptional regulator with XRE-family HTH domain [Longispora fulva]GIG57682.1 transcriptional regulator [Longispora fulva]